MQDQRSPGNVWLPDPDEVARVVLGIALRRYPGLVAIDDLMRELTHPSLRQSIDEPLIHDALVDLTTSGLLHRLDGFVFPTRATLRGGELI